MEKSVRLLTLITFHTITMPISFFRYTTFFLTYDEAEDYVECIENAILVQMRDEIERAMSGRHVSNLMVIIW
jgi:hypothetical protein